MSQKNHALVKEHELIEARKRLEDAVPTLEKVKKKPTAPKKTKAHSSSWR